jgi:hypothetical protein
MCGLLDTSDAVPVSKSNRVDAAPPVRFFAEDQHDRTATVSKDPDSRSGREAGAKGEACATPTRNDGPQVMTGDRIVWISDQGPEYGVVRWIGHIPGDDDLLAGVEFVSAVA